MNPDRINALKALKQSHQELLAVAYPEGVPDEMARGFRDAYQEVDDAIREMEAQWDDYVAEAYRMNEHQDKYPW